MVDDRASALRLWSLTWWVRDSETAARKAQLPRVASRHRRIRSLDINRQRDAGKSHPNRKRPARLLRLIRGTLLPRPRSSLLQSPRRGLRRSRGLRRRLGRHFRSGCHREEANFDTSNPHEDDTTGARAEPGSPPPENPLQRFLQGYEPTRPTNRSIQLIRSPSDLIAGASGDSAPPRGSATERAGSPLSASRDSRRIASETAASESSETPLGELRERKSSHAGWTMTSNALLLSLLLLAAAFPSLALSPTLLRDGARSQPDGHSMLPSGAKEPILLARGGPPAAPHVSQQVEYSGALGTFQRLGAAVPLPQPRSEVEIGGSWVGG